MIRGASLAAAGGAMGALARWAITLAFPTTADAFPWATFAINVVGSLLLAALPLLPVVRRVHWLPILLGTGLLGGFTTMSAASTETVLLLDAGHVGVALTYVLGTLAAALLAVRAVDLLSSPALRAAFAADEGDE